LFVLGNANKRQFRERQELKPNQEPIAGANRCDDRAPLRKSTAPTNAFTSPLAALLGVSSEFVWELIWGMIVAEVRLQEGESIENALRRFKRKVQTEEIIKEVRRHSFYLKPGARRRLKQALARKRARKKTRKDSDSARKD
jgi:small subunit ribosomal protein S21